VEEGFGGRGSKGVAEVELLDVLAE